MISGSYAPSFRPSMVWPSISCDAAHCTHSRAASGVSIERPPQPSPLPGRTYEYMWGATMVLSAAIAFSRSCHSNPPWGTPRDVVTPCPNQSL